MRELLDVAFGHLDLDWKRYVKIDSRYFDGSAFSDLFTLGRNETAWMMDKCPHHLKFKLLLFDVWAQLYLKSTPRDVVLEMLLEYVDAVPPLPADLSGHEGMEQVPECQTPFFLRTVVNPLLDVQRYLPGSVYAANYANFEDPEEVDLYDKMLRETDPAKQRALMRDFEKYVLDTEAHDIFLLWWYRMVPYHAYVKGWKVSPSHYLNQDLATVWLDK